jgi:hypothetical protein
VEFPLLPPYNDVNNQQDATIFLFTNLFNSALHVSDDKFAHPQEHFWTMYSFWYDAPTLLPTGALYQKLYIHSKSAPEDGRICRPKHVGLN